jgi:cytidylate kinase
MIIAIDGPAGAGKSTVAQGVAHELGLAFLDTGAMYRAVTLVVIQRGSDPADGAACERVAREVVLTFDADGCIEIDGEPGEPDIRSETVTRTVSAVSAHRGVREAVVGRQRELFHTHHEARGMVVEGRDTTTVVFPEAEHKFFLIASAAERARRRAIQTGRADELEVIQRDIERRDRLDTTRAHSPLVQAPDATVIDTDGLDAAAVIAAIVAEVSADPKR